jgi:hypothetical protein
MNVTATFETNAEATKVVQPGMRTLDDPSVLSEATAMGSAAFGDNRLNASFAERLPVLLGVVRTIGIDGSWLLKRTTADAANRRYGVDQRQQFSDVVLIGAAQNCRDRDAGGVGGDMVFGTGSRTISGVRTGFWPAPSARIDDESTTTRQKSIWSAARSLASSNWCSWSQTPACCHAFKRRQQVTPEPHPISAGKSRQRRPVFKTNKMPGKAARWDTGRRPDTLCEAASAMAVTVRSVPTVRRR